MRYMINYGIIISALFFLVALLLSTTSVVLAQTVYESEQFGYRLQIPQGWVIEEEEVAFEDPALKGSQVLAMLCRESEALPGIGGEYNCQAAALTDLIIIIRWPDLQSRQEFQNQNENNNRNSSMIITTNDLVALWIQGIQNETSRIRIQNSTDVDEFRKIVDMTFQYHDKGDTFLPFDDSTYSMKTISMFVLDSQDRNTGYIILNPRVDYDNLAITQPQHSPAVQEVFDSFELVTPPTISPPRAATTPTTPSLPQQQEVQQPQNQEAPVSIVSGSSSLTTDAYAPNPIEVGVGDTVTWTNDDSQPHTATSGDPVTVTPDGRFDSGIMAPAATFDFTFTEAGEYPYFCLLHPNMVATVQVG